MSLADVHHLDVLDAVARSVDVQVDLEIDQPVVHVRDRPRVHLHAEWQTAGTPACTPRQY